MLRTVWIALALLALMLRPAPVHARTWYDNTGKHKTEARFVDVDGETVHLRRDSDQKLIKIKKSRLNRRELELLAALDHKDQAEAAKHLLRQDQHFAVDADGRITALNFYDWTDDPDQADPDDLDKKSDWAPATDADLEQASKLSSVEYVRLAVTDAISPRGLAHVARMPNVTEIELTFQTSVDVDQYVEALAPLKGLERFSLADCGHITDASLKVIAGWTDLGSLSIEQTLPGTPGLTDAGVLSLGSLKGLYGLYLVAHDLSDASLAVLDQLPELYSLEWGSANHPLTGEGARRIAARANLRGLTIRAKVGDDALPILTVLEKIDTLELKACQLTDAQLEPIARFTALQALNLSSNPIEGTGLVHLADLTGLYLLDLRDTHLTAAGLQALADLQSIEVVDLSGTPITDEQLALLEPLKANKLCLSRTEITNAGLLNLKGNQHVKRVIVNNSPADQSGVEAMVKARESAGVASIADELDALVNAPVTKGDPALGKTPEEAFAQIKEAAGKNDWATVLNCLTPGSRSMPGLMAVGMYMGEAGNEGKALVQRFIAADKLDQFAEEASKIKSDKDAIALAQRVLAEVKNPAALLGVCVKLAAARRPNAHWLGSLPTKTLENVKVTGASAIGNIHTDENSYSPTGFRRIDGVWYVDLLD
jgi:hypothetical protein